MRLGFAMARVFALSAGLVLAGCTVAEVKEREQPAPKLAALETSRGNSRACASSTVYERIKAQAFEQAAAVHGGRSTMLDRLAGEAIVRMDSPFVKGVDPAIGVTICGGTFIVELPPGFNDLFDGDRRIAAEVEYASQPAADGSGLVFRMTGAEPVIYRLAAVALRDDAKDLPPAAIETPEPIQLAAVPEVVAPVVEAPKPVTPKPVALAAKPVEKKVRQLAEVKAKPTKPARMLAKLEPKKAEARKPEPRKLALIKANPKLQLKKPAVAVKTAPKAEPKRLAVAAKKSSPPTKARSLLNASFGKSLRETARGEATPAKAKPAVAKSTPKPVARAAPCSVGSTAERLLCADRALAAKDRRVRQVYQRTFASLPPEGRRALRATAARFESYRAGCRTAGCISSAYDERQDEIDEIAADYGG